MAVKKFVFTAGCLFLIAKSMASTLPSPAVLTPTVSYLGGVSKQDNNVEYFRGIPFASSPVGSLRWQAPNDFNHTSAQYDARQFKPACYQDSYNISWYQDVAQYFGHDLVMEMPEVSEDCLYLNIWRQSSDTSQRPVLVWIHGGSNKAGWSYEPNYLPDNLVAKHDVIVISIAYRLGVFGFFAHSGLDNQTIKTNFGLLDQVAALRWIQDNITHFGGDPNNITLFGESAGAANIGSLMSSPLTKGLFHKAISQSGGFQLHADSRFNNAKIFGAAVSNASKVETIAELRTLPSKLIWQASKKADPNYNFRAINDGHFLHSTPVEAYKKHAEVDLLIGTNLHEYYMYQPEEIKVVTAQYDFLNPSLNLELLNQVPVMQDLKLAQNWIDTFVYMSCPSIKMAIESNKKGHKAWVYRFDREREKSDKIKAYHGAEIPYVFNSHDEWLPVNQDDIELTNYITNAWVNFAKYSNPNGNINNNQNTWPEFSFDNLSMLTLTYPIKTIKNSHLHLCQKMWQ